MHRLIRLVSHSSNKEKPDPQMPFLDMRPTCLGGRVSCRPLSPRPLYNRAILYAEPLATCHAASDSALKDAWHVTASLPFRNSIFINYLFSILGGANSYSWENLSVSPCHHVVLGDSRGHNPPAEPLAHRRLRGSTASGSAMEDATLPSKRIFHLRFSNSRNGLAIRY